MAPTHWLLTDPTRRARYLAFVDGTLRDAHRTALPIALLDRFRTKTSVLSRECRSLARDGVYLEFGVFRGRSIRRAARILRRRKLHGFDSFEGLPRDGRTDWGQDFAVAQLPQVPRNVALHKGWFDATLPAFLEQLTAPVALVHVDCDIHSSTHFVLSELHRQGRLVPGLRIVFDELFNHPTAMWNEHLALFEVLEDTGLGLRWRGITRRARLPADTIDLLERGAFPTREMRHATRDAGYWFQAGAIELTAEPLAIPDASLARARDLSERFAQLTAKHYGGKLRPSHAVASRK